MNLLQTRSVSLERFIVKLGVLEQKNQEAVVLALAVVVQFSVNCSSNFAVIPEIVCHYECYQN